MITRKALSQIFPVLGCLALATSVSAAVNLNGGLSYTNDFDNLNDFEPGIAHWQNSAVFAGGVGNMTAQGSSFNSSHTNPNTGNIANSSSGKNAGSSNTPFTFPASGLAPKIAASSFSTLNPRFGGNWMITQGVGNYSGGTNGTWAGTGSSVLQLENMGAHTALNISMVLAIGDSFDNNQADGHDGPFQVLVDGIVVYQARFSGGGGLISESWMGQNENPTESPMDRKHSNLNASPSYLEKWNDNGGNGPLNADDRYAENWTLDSLWEFNLTLAHVDPNATIEFRHHVTSALTDEYLAIDSLRVTAVPEPTVVALGGLGLGFLVLRRRRTAVV